LPDLACGATKGYVYLRSEYPVAIRIMEAPCDRPGLLGGVLGPDFDMEIRVGAGAYVCGEETSLLNSLEGKRGVVRAKPPLPALQGFLGRPTVVNNVISLASVPVIMAKGCGVLQGLRAWPFARHDPVADRRERALWRAL
jgi:formate dehydrogenase iron-sulfur subunit